MTWDNLFLIEDHCIRQQHNNISQCLINQLKGVCMNHQIGTKLIIQLTHKNTKYKNKKTNIVGLQDFLPLLHPPTKAFMTYCSILREQERKQVLTF